MKLTIVIESKKKFMVLLCMLLSSLAWMSVNRQENDKWPKPIYDARKNPSSRASIELGRMLFYEKALSKDSSISCASCHMQFAAFSNPDHPLSHGIAQQLSSRNAPALQNLGWHPYFMQDGRSLSLDAQFLIPLTAKNEMGSTLAEILVRLRKDRNYAKLFKAAFGNEMITAEKMGKALSQFQMQLISNNSKYDQVIRGEKTFSLPEQLGFQIFLNKCASCHPAPLFSNFSFVNIGMPLDPLLKDYGRMTVTGLAKDSLCFKVPSLRNVMETAPYGHDGRFFSLQDLFEHYRTQFKIPISNYEIGQLTAFLSTLTDSSFINHPNFSDPKEALNYRPPNS